MPIAHIHATERVIHVEQPDLLATSPALYEVKAALCEVPSDFQVFDADTLTDITPACFTSWSEKEILPDTRFMLDVADDGESARVQMMPGKGAIRNGSEKVIGVVSSERPCIVGHKNELGWYIGGLVLRVPPARIERYRKFFGAGQED